MNPMFALPAMLLVDGGPVAIEAWIGSRMCQGWSAFLKGCAATLHVRFLGAFVAESMSYAADPERSGGLRVLVLPLTCLFAGALGGVVAFVIVRVQNWKPASTPPAVHLPGTPEDEFSTRP